MYVEYEKATEPIVYPFTSGQKEVTLIRSWFFVIAAILGVVVLILSVASLRVGRADGFWNYDGLSRMMRDPRSPSVMSVVGLVGGGGFSHIGFVRDVQKAKRVGESVLFETWESQTEEG